jgi:hypothetical protein
LEDVPTTELEKFLRRRAYRKAAGESHIDPSNLD